MGSSEIQGVISSEMQKLSISLWASKSQLSQVDEVLLGDEVIREKVFFLLRVPIM